MTRLHPSKFPSGWKQMEIQGNSKNQPASHPSPQATHRQDRMTWTTPDLAKAPNSFLSLLGPLTPSSLEISCQGVCILSWRVVSRGNLGGHSRAPTAVLSSSLQLVSLRHGQDLRGFGGCGSAPCCCLCLLAPRGLHGNLHQLARPVHCSPCRWHILPLLDQRQHRCPHGSDPDRPMDLQWISPAERIFHRHDQGHLGQSCHA